MAKRKTKIKQKRSKIKQRKRKISVRRKKPFYTKKLFWLLVLFFCVFSAIAYLVFFSGVFSIKETNISGTEKVLNEDILKLIEPELKTQIPFYGDLSNVFLVKPADIQNLILHAFPSVENVHLKRKLPDTLIIEIKEKQMVAVFCDFSEDCFFVDSMGIAFEKIEAGDSIVFKLEENKKIVLAEMAIEPELLSAAFLVSENLKKQVDLNLREYLVIGNTLGVIEASGYRIYFDLRGDINNQAMNLGLVLQKEITPETFKSIEYIDLRFGNRIFYK